MGLSELSHDSGDGYVILMTSCIDPSTGPAKIQRADPIVRLADYKRGLQFWLELPDERVKRILYVDNSGYPLDELRLLARDANPYEKEVEFVSSVDNNYPPELTYGYAELSMIDRAFSKSALIERSRYVIKATGRMQFRNVPCLLDKLPPQYLFAVDCRDNTHFVRVPQRCVHAHLMIFRKSFYVDHLLGIKNRLDAERNQGSISLLLFQELMKFKGTNGAIFRWPVNLYSVGYSAKENKIHHSARAVMVNLARGVCRRLLPNWWV